MHTFLLLLIGFLLIGIGQAQPPYYVQGIC